MDVPVVAGVISTVLFAISTLPMLRKAVRTKDLQSYSAGNLAMSNAGNAFHSVYVFSLPVGPIWFLHSFYVISAALMLIWYLRYRTAARNSVGRRPRVHDLSVARGRVAASGLNRTRPADLEVAA